MWDCAGGYGLEMGWVIALPMQLGWLPQGRGCQTRPWSLTAAEGCCGQGRMLGQGCWGPSLVESPKQVGTGCLELPLLESPKRLQTSPSQGCWVMQMSGWGYQE